MTNIDNYIDRLIAVSTYARWKAVTSETIRLKCLLGKMESRVIDNKRFVILNDEDYEQFKAWRK